MKRFRLSPVRAIAVMAVAAGVVGAAAASGIPARADMIGNSFLAALTNAGVPYNDPASATALGQSVCPLLVEPGATFDNVAASMAADSGMAHNAANVFTLLAISAYCPGLLSPILPDRYSE
jgi:hypothetical protein